MVREPLQRFASALLEILRRALRGICPEGPCDEERDGFNQHAREKLEEATVWHRVALDMDRDSATTPGSPAHEAWLGKVAEVVRAMIIDASCNLEYYAAEHLLTQTTLLRQGEMLDGSANVTLLTLESGQSHSLPQGFLELIGAHTLPADAVQQCVDDASGASNERMMSAGKGLPTEAEVLDVIRGDEGLQLMLCSMYAQDYACLSHAPPVGACEALLGKADSPNGQADAPASSAASSRRASTARSVSSRSRRAPRSSPNRTSDMAAKPARVILICHGRGGSTSTSQVLNLFSGYESGDKNTGLRTELFGINAAAMEDQEDPTALMLDYFDTEERTHPRARTIGFKWKPLVFNEAYDQALDVVAKSGIRVVYQTRNFLDVYISSTKHAAEELSDRCSSDDAECIEAHSSLQVTLEPKKMIDTLNRYKSEHESMVERLNSYGVNYLNVTYDDLYAGVGDALVPVHGTDLALATWNATLEHVGLGGVPSYADIQTALASAYAPTTAATQCDSLLNADEVRSALRGTEHEGLLRC